MAKLARGIALTSALTIADMRLIGCSPPAPLVAPARRANLAEFVSQLNKSYDCGMLGEDDGAPGFSCQEGPFSNNAYPYYIRGDDGIPAPSAAKDVEPFCRREKDEKFAWYVRKFVVTPFLDSSAQMYCMPGEQIVCGACDYDASFPVGDKTRGFLAKHPYRAQPKIGIFDGWLDGLQCTWDTVMQAQMIYIACAPKP